MIVGLSVLFKYLYPLELHRTADSSLTTIEHQTNVLKTMCQIEVHNFFFHLRDRCSDTTERYVYTLHYTHCTQSIICINIRRIAVHVYHHFIVIFSTLKLMLVFFKKIFERSRQDQNAYIFKTLHIACLHYNVPFVAFIISASVNNFARVVSEF